MPQGRGRKTKKPKRTKQPDMVVVTVTKDRSGRSLEVGTTGNVPLTEAPTLLRLAAKVAEQQLGLE